MTGTTHIQTQITKEDIDAWFVKNYIYIKNAVNTQISYYLKKHNKKPLWEADILITNAYEHLIKNKEKITERKSNIQAFFRGYIKLEASNYNSKINKFEREHPKLNYTNEIFDYNDDEDDSDLKHKLYLEKLYNIQKSVLVNCIKTLNAEERVLFDVIYIQEINTIAALSRHFDVNRHTIRKKLIPFYTKINTFIDNNYKIN
jgi:hypothetical protein